MPWPGLVVCLVVFDEYDALAQLFLLLAFELFGCGCQCVGLGFPPAASLAKGFPFCPAAGFAGFDEGLHDAFQNRHGDTDSDVD